MNSSPESDDVLESGLSENRTQIDDQPLAAALGIFLGLIPTGILYAAFSDFGTTMLPWKICGAITALVPIFVLAHYFINRHTRRMWWAGCASLCGAIPIWLLFGSWWLFYFGFAPMPTWIRVMALVLCGVVSAYWLVLVWRDFADVTIRRQLEDQLFTHESSRITFSIRGGSRILPFLKQRNPFTRLHIFAATTVAPIFIGIILTSSHALQPLKGPHVVFLVGSFFAFPLSLYLLAYLFAKIAFFDIYLPLKLEHQTGKMVIIAP
jgi:hypothetical protein